MKTVALLAILCSLPAAAQRRAVSMNNWYKHANFYQMPESRVVIPNPQTKQMDVAYQFTPEYEMSLGNQAYQQLVQGASVINDPEVQSYFDRMIQKIISTTPGPNFPYRVTVLNAPGVVNAVTPPGYVIVYSGLVSKVQSEAELAAVISHELAHNYAHHTVRQIGKSAYIQASINAVMTAVQRKGAAVQMITGIGSQLGANLFLKAYSRSEEKEADLYGTHLMFNAGYNPTAMSTFFLRLYQDRPKQPFKLMSTHPSDPDRANYVSDYLEGFPLDREFVLDSDAFHMIQRKLGFDAPAPAPQQNASPAGPGLTSRRLVDDQSTASQQRSPQSPASTIPTPPSIPDPPTIPDPPRIPAAPTQTTPSPARTPQRQPTPTVTRSEPAREQPTDFPALDNRQLQDFIRKNVPAGATTTGATREGGIEITRNDAGLEGACQPGRCGNILWDGEAKKGMIVTIDGSRPSVGTLEGGLPGTPVRVINDMPEDVTILEQPSARNGWKRLVFRLKYEGGFTFTLRWKAI